MNFMTDIVMKFLEADSLSDSTTMKQLAGYLKVRPNRALEIYQKATGIEGGYLNEKARLAGRQTVNDRHLQAITSVRRVSGNESSGDDVDVNDLVQNWIKSVLFNEPMPSRSCLPARTAPTSSLHVGAAGHARNPTRMPAVEKWSRHDTRNPNTFLDDCEMYARVYSQTIGRTIGFSMEGQVREGWEAKRRLRQRQGTLDQNDNDGLVLAF